MCVCLYKAQCLEFFRNSLETDGNILIYLSVQPDTGGIVVVFAFIIKFSSIEDYLYLYQDRVFISYTLFSGSELLTNF